MKLEEKRKEGIKRMTKLCTQLNLKNQLLTNLKDGIVEYSFAEVIPFGGYIISSNELKNDEKYNSIIQNFEKEKNCFVYHAIEARIQGMLMLSILYVSDCEEEWSIEQLDGNRIFTYTINLDIPEYSEYGSIYLESYYGQLMRIF